MKTMMVRIIGHPVTGVAHTASANNQLLSARIRLAPFNTTSPISNPTIRSGYEDPVQYTSRPARMTPVLAITSLAEKIQLALIWTPPWRLRDISIKHTVLATKATLAMAIIKVERGAPRALCAEVEISIQDQLDKMKAARQDLELWKIPSIAWPDHANDKVGDCSILQRLNRANDLHDA